jgi:hypothetical protein
MNIIKGKERSRRKERNNKVKKKEKKVKGMEHTFRYPVMRSLKNHTVKYLQSGRCAPYSPLTSFSRSFLLCSILDKCPTVTVSIDFLKN